MKKKYRLYGKNRKVFLDGLQQYENRGVSILIDGKKADASQWEQILEERSDGSFYMGDYIWEEETFETGDKENEQTAGYLSGKIRESPEKYNPRKKLIQIRFDRVYHH